MMNGDVALCSKLIDQLLDRTWSDNFVRFALNDDSRGGAGRQETEIIHVRGWRDRDEATDLRAAHQELHSNPGAKTHAGNPGCLSFGMDLLHPVERACSVRQFADAIVEDSLALADTPKIEPERREAALHERLIEQLDDLVVHCAAGLRVRVQDEGNGSARASTGMEASFEASLRAWENDFGHVSGCALE